MELNRNSPYSVIFDINTNPFHNGPLDNDPDFEVPTPDPELKYFINIKVLEEILVGSTEETVQGVATGVIRSPSKRREKKTALQNKKLEMAAAEEQLLEEYKASHPTVEPSEEERDSIESNLLKGEQPRPSPTNTRWNKITPEESSQDLSERLDNFCMRQAEYFAYQVIDKALEFLAEFEPSSLYDIDQKFKEIKGHFIEEFSKKLDKELSCKTVKRTLNKVGRFKEEESLYYVEKFSIFFDEQLYQFRASEVSYIPITKVGDRKARKEEIALAENCFQTYMIDYSQDFLFLTYERMRIAYDLCMAEYERISTSSGEKFVDKIASMLRINDNDFINFLKSLNKEEDLGKNSLVIAVANQIYRVNLEASASTSEKELFKSFYLLTFDRFHSESLEKVEQEYTDGLAAYKEFDKADVFQSEDFLSQLSKMFGIEDEKTILKLVKLYLADLYSEDLNINICKDNCLQRVLKTAKIIRKVNEHKSSK